VGPGTNGSQGIRVRWDALRSPGRIGAEGSPGVGQRGLAPRPGRRDGWDAGQLLLGRSERLRHSLLQEGGLQVAIRCARSPRLNLETKIRRSHACDGKAAMVFLVNTGKQLILVDAGSGQWFGGAVRSPGDEASQRRIYPEQVDLELITHLHSDHIGVCVPPRAGSTRPPGSPRTPWCSSCRRTSRSPRSASA
jgi:metallo-beta-lactamase superfamily protein